MEPASPTAGSRRLRLIIFIVLAAVVAGVALLSVRGTGIGSLMFELLFTQLARLQQAKTDYPVTVYLAAGLLYVVATGLSMPGAAIMTLAYGWMFGFWQALVLVSFSSTAGATIAFLSSRFLFHDFIQSRFGHRLAGFNESFRRDGAFYLFTLRLMPAIPFIVTNAGMGLTPIKVRTYWWVSQLGMLPGTAVYVYAGTALPGLDELRNASVTKVLSPQLLVALILLGLFPLVIKKVMQRFVKPASQPPVLPE